MDESWVEGVILPLSVLESNTRQEHLSASALTNQDKQEVTKEEKWTSVLESNTLIGKKKLAWEHQRTRESR